MIPECQLFIRRVLGSLRSRVGDIRLNELRGGPETLLQWLETQLGLPIPDAPVASRIAEYATALDSLDNSKIGASLLIDRWATASELLARRDELMLAGWDESDSETLPPVVRALAQAADGRTFTFLGEADRLRRVLGALDAGQVLPPHRCTLADPLERWPLAWRNVLSRLTLAEPPQTRVNGPSGSALYVAQSTICGQDSPAIEQDPSFRYVHSRSQSAAVELVAAALAESREKLANTVICCEDDELALRLDACLNRLGLPTSGASATSRAHPILQLLPLSLALCWEPVDPQTLLDFLTLSVGPIPKRAARRLAGALQMQPGLGSREWETVLENLCLPDNDPEEVLKQRLDHWLHFDRVTKGDDIPTSLVRLRAGLVAQWAGGWVAVLEQEDDCAAELLEAFRSAAGQASLLRELAESQGNMLSEPQLKRLVEEVTGAGAAATAFPEADGGPTRVRSLAEVRDPYARLIWLGLGTSDAAGSRWSTRHMRDLRSAGVELDDGSQAVTALRSAEASGFGSITEALLAVLLPQDLEKRWHPIWLAMRERLSQENLDEPAVIEDLVSRGEGNALQPFTFRCQPTTIKPPPPERRLWDIPADLLKEPPTVSATELADRLACPLKWTLERQAKLYAGSTARLPDNFRLKGNFCHSVLEQVLGDGEELPSPNDAVVRVLAAFDARLPLDAAPLAQPDQLLEQRRLRQELELATRRLVEALADGDYRIVGFEVPLSGQASGKDFKGRIDCLAARDDGQEAIIDLKYGGRKKYQSLVEEGKTLQLATYAYGRSQSSGSFPAVAYLVLSEGLLFTPSGSPLAGAGNHAIDGDSMRAVWQRFSDALTQASDWLTTDAPVPARPLQNAAEWPAGTELTLEANLKADELQAVCRYCDYPNICGVRRIH
ncbi:MAG: PD-(D/E)XK nuclease family protein [Candidatus Paceibacterota bacterium]